MWGSGVSGVRNGSGPRIIFDDALLNALTCGDTGELAGIYLELGRVLAKLSQFNDAAAHATRGKVLLERSGDPSDLAAAAITVGQLEMLHGDSVTAETRAASGARSGGGAQR